MKYSPEAIEKKWQDWWEKKGVFKTEVVRDKEKFYCLDFFPYPSGDGLSVGHCRNYIPTDIISRYKRMRGFNVLHPMGWDAFGLPAENEAINKGLHPKITVPKYIANYKRQLKMIGSSYDWSREINSSRPEYYKWTQWFFLLLYKRGLAYQKEAPVNFCPKCKTVLANEEVENGLCWRCHTPVVKKNLRQWFFRITNYADRLLKDIKKLNWPENILLMQENWIGRSEGVEFTIDIKGRKNKISVFTTRPDTIYGMTFVVLAPEHPLVKILTTQERKDEVSDYIEKTKRESEVERVSLKKEPEGVFTGSFAINPINGAIIPIYISDYVLMEYGTGAIMAVPAHDERDFKFAKKYNLPIKQVIKPPSEVEGAYIGEGTVVNSGPFTGLSSTIGREKIIRFMEERGIGKKKINYKIRDWLISRQRYWGAPIPTVYCKKCGIVPVPESELPVTLPDVEHYEPSGTGKSPLARIPEFVNTTCPRCGGKAKRETDTMGGFACSSWYFLRFASPDEGKAPFRKEDVKYWLPVDLYVGGAEHAVMHLLYARFWTKVMFDAGLISFDEPFTELKNQGVVHAPDGKRMSKSAGNVITPDSVVEKYGADTLRLYEAFMAPFDQSVRWSEEGIIGCRRFLNRICNGFNKAKYKPDWRKNIEAKTSDEREIRKKLHFTIKKVTNDIENLKFNTAISRMMELVNEIYIKEVNNEVYSEAIENLILLLAPFAPHLSEELWFLMDKKDSIFNSKWPEYDRKIIKEETVNIVVEVNGRVRGTITVDKNKEKEEVERLAISLKGAQRWIEGKRIKRVIFVPERLINIVV
jgi:leucyl-tRNA synthetase